METGMFRKQHSQIEEDMLNQETARKQLELLLEVEVRPQHTFSTWDWEFYKQDKLIAIGEYRRRFVTSNTYPDFNFSKNKFYKMKAKSDCENIKAIMFVEFNDGLKYFNIEGEPSVKTMQRRGEVRTEEVVIIPNNFLFSIESLIEEFK